MNWKISHTAIIGALLIAVGTQLSGLEHGFADALTPAFLGGLLVQIGTTIGALFVGSPVSRTVWTDQQRDDYREAKAVESFPHSANRS